MKDSKFFELGFAPSAQFTLKGIVIKLKRLISILIAAALALSLTAAAAVVDGTVTISGRPSGITAMPDGTLLITDVWDMAVWSYDGRTAKKLTQDGERDLLGKVIGVSVDGAVSEAEFSEPFDIEPYNGGYAVSDSLNNSIRFISGDLKNVTTIAGGEKSGFKDGEAKSALFNRPAGLAADDDGNLYIADTGNNAIRMLDKNGRVTTVEDGFNAPMGLSWYDGVLYAADSGNHRIAAIENGVMRVVAGGVMDESDEEEVSSGSYRNGSVKVAGFSYPQGVLACESGIYVADSGNGAVRVIENGVVTTLHSGGLISPRGLTLLEGKLYVTDTNRSAITIIRPETKTAEFTDITPDSPWFKDVETLASFEIFQGTESGEFNPDGAMTRADIVTLLSRLHTVLYPDTIIAGESEAFDDVPSDAYYADAVQWSRELGAVDGIGENLFSPDTILSREAAAAFVYKYAKAAGYDTQADGSFGFSDLEQVSGWARDAVLWAVGTGVYKTESDTLDPNDEATRGFVAHMMSRVFELEG